ncbi:RNA polymerase III RPC4-domain-containing protein [Crepidotus variabilis]|uniref:RNA polymerase III RPC4-domain-containing protein n=1 Tax=Crepidotus variabilis TaxID=179855 RepID=A0A9P6JMM1_9AGAR|nr:RNA polymerase III RPC4-domain-containing protein [Crepidotus variabilis]
MSGPSSSSTPKAIGSLAKKPSDVTRQGTQKLKFVPTLPVRRKKEEVKQESSVEQASRPDRGVSRGRGRGGPDGRGRGRGKGGPPPVEMTASGPFAMGPGQVGNSNRQAAPQSSFVPNMLGEGSSLGARSLSQTGPPSLRKSNDLNSISRERVKPEDEEVYSDPDDGIEIVDMGNVREMDWMAPEILLKERQGERKKAKKEEAVGDDLSDEVVVESTQALNLSESEEEEEMDDIMSSFMARAVNQQGGAFLQDRLYLFQLPSPFPTFSSNQTPMEVDKALDSGEKRVSFAPNVKQDTSTSSRTAYSAPDTSEQKQPSSLEGRIGQLEFYRSGAVKMRLANHVLLDVNAATQPSFLQQAVHIAPTRNQLVVLGEVNTQFAATPNVDALLIALEEAETAKKLNDDTLIKMD